jgi:hypothetical protein
VVLEEYNLVRQRAAMDVQAGRAPAAAKSIRQYRAKKRKENDFFQNAKVEAHLRSLGYLVEEVEAAGEATPAARNRFAKDTLSEALDDRRQGSKYTASEK